jgi:hypothetical protein
MADSYTNTRKWQRSWIRGFSKMEEEREKEIKKLLQ